MVATTIGIDLLVQAARDLGVALRLRVGYLAYGLSTGTKEKTARIHANYITYPKIVTKTLSKTLRQRLNLLESRDGEIYVVGDMGDAAKSMANGFDERYPWNAYRDDPHGEHEQSKKIQKLQGAKPPLCMYFSNGGYLLRSFVKCLGQDSNQREKVICAKRVWSDDVRYGYGVLITGM